MLEKSELFFSVTQQERSIQEWVSPFAAIFILAMILFVETVEMLWARMRKTDRLFFGNYFILRA